MKIVESEFITNGKVISGGICIGKVCHYQVGFSEPKAIFDIPDEIVPLEIAKLYSSIEASQRELEALVENVKKMLGENEAKIFETHIFMLQDANLIKKIENMIKNQKVNVEYAVKVVFEEIEDVFSKMDDEYMKDRGTDIAEVKRRLLNHLIGEKGKFLCAQHCIVDENRVVFADELTSNMISLISNNNVKGFVVRSLSENSHAAILVKAAGVPCITDIDIIDSVKCGTVIILDGENNKLILNPEKETIRKYEESLKEIRKEKYIYDDIKSPVLFNNKYIEINANILTLADFHHVDEKFSSIGLVRTEFLFYDDPVFPDLEKQKYVYSEIVRRAKDLNVTFRLFDLGGDKKLKSITFPAEDNPLLGLRGVRYLLKNRKILEDQLTAIIFACENKKVKILLPMVTDISEFREVKSLIDSIKKRESIDCSIEVGVMFEVPIAVLKAEEFFKEIDFGSIGTNDLIQYLYGVDRNNSSVNRIFALDSNSFFLFVKKIADAASSYNKSLTLCGEIDYDSDFLFNMIDIGVRKFSISPLSFKKFLKKLKEKSF